MAYLLNLIYLAAWLVLTPWLCWQTWFHKKPLRGLKAKWLGLAPAAQTDDRPVAWFHGVSVGEIHLLRQVVAQFRRRFPDWQCVVSTTTATGFDEAIKHFSDIPVFFWPFDFTWAVQRALRTVRPTLVVLSEGEMWPNFVAAAKRQGVKLALINGRMSPRSARRFLNFRWLLAGVFRQLDWIGAQNDEYRAHYARLGALHVVSTGNIKYDGVNTDRNNARTQAMRRLFAVGPEALTWVAGSTQEPEEALAVAIYRRAKARFPALRLILVPRHPERFDEVAQLLQRSGLPFVRRSDLLPSPPVLRGREAGGEGVQYPLRQADSSQGDAHPRTPGPSPPSTGERGELANAAVPQDAIILVDTIGELGALWGLADVAFVGGSLDGKRGGQNMIEPSAYGAAVVFGPHIWNFKQTVADLLARDAAFQVQDAAALEAAVLRLLGDAALRQRLGQAARQFALSQQGATERTLDALQTLLGIEAGKMAA